MPRISKPKQHPGFPRSSVAVRIREHSLYSASLGLEGIGRLWARINTAMKAGDEAFLGTLPFLGRYVRGASPRPHIPMDVRRRVLAAGKCAKCERSERLEIDHIVPFSKGGAHDESNFQCLCKKCNRKKSDVLEAAK